MKITNNFEAQRDLVYDTGLFDTINPKDKWLPFRLSGTNYYLGIQYSYLKAMWNCIWLKEREKIIHPLKPDLITPIYKEISFQEVFDNSPILIKEKMMYHLELLK